MAPPLAPWPHRGCRRIQMGCAKARETVPYGGLQDAPVAQLDRAFDYESKGRTFESCRAHHFNSLAEFPQTAHAPAPCGTGSRAAALIHFALPERDTHTQQAATAIGRDVRGNSAGNRGSAMMDLFAAYVQNQALDVTQGQPAPASRFLVQQLTGPANLGMRYVDSAEPAHEFGGLTAGTLRQVFACIDGLKCAKCISYMAIIRVIS